MANPIVQTTSAGATVATDGGGYQLIKLVDGSTSATTPIIGTSGTPAAGTFGLVVAVKPGVSVVAQASGTVSVSGPVQASGTVTVSNLTTVVSGTVTAVLPGSTTGSSGMSGVLVWLGASQSVLIGGQSVTAQVSGTVSVSGTIPVTGTIQNVASISTILGTAIVSVVPGVSVVAQASGTVTVSNLTTVVSGTLTALLPGSTTGSSGMSGVIVWLGASQTVLISTQVSGTVSVSNFSTQVSGTVSVSGTVPVTGTLNQLNTIVTILSTVQVNVVAGGAAPGSTAATQSNISGQVVWLAPTQTMQVVSTVATVLGTMDVFIRGGAAGGGSVVTTQAGGTSTGQLVYLAANQTITVVPSVSVSLAVNASTTANIPTATATGLQVWLIGGQTATGTPVIVTGTIIQSAGASVSAVVSGTVTVSGLVGHSITGSVNIVSTATVVVANFASMTTVSGTITVSNFSTQVSGTVSISGTPVVTGTISALDVGRTQVMIVVAGISMSAGTTLAFTIDQGGTRLTAGTTCWTVPAGKVFRVLNVQLVAQNSVATTPVDHELAVLVSSALPTWTSTCPRVAAVMVNAASQTISYSACAVGIADVAAGSTIAIGYSNNTAGTLVRAFINGYIFP